MQVERLGRSAFLNAFWEDLQGLRLLKTLGFLNPVLMEV